MQPTGGADLAMNSNDFRLFYIGMLSLEKGIEKGDITGDAKAALAFIGMFDWPKSK